MILGRRDRPGILQRLAVSLPRLGGHLRKVGSTSTGRDDGARAQAAAVHRRVQGRGGEAAGGERQGPAAGRRRARRPRQPAPGLAQRAAGGRLGRGPGPAEGRGRRAGAAAAREEAARAGERDPQAGRGFFRPGGGRRHEVPLRRRRARDLPGADAVPDRRRRGERLLRLAAPRAGPPPRGRPAAGREDRGDLRGEPADLRQPAGPRRAAGGGRPDRPQAGGAAHARGRPDGRAPPAPRPAHDRQPARPPGRAEPARPELRGRPAGHGLAGRHLATSRPARAGCTWPRSRTWPPARSSAGAWPTTSASELACDALRDGDPAPAAAAAG